MSTYSNFANNALRRRTLLAEQRNFEAFKKVAVYCLQVNMLDSLSSWNSQLPWIDVLKQLATIQNTQTLFHLGKKMAENILFPQEIHNIQDALTEMDTVYHDYYSEEEKNRGHYHFLPIDDQCAKMICSTPYPCEFDRGVIEGICQRFKSKEIEFVIVEHLNGFPCREKASDSCSYSISWISTYKENKRFEKVTVVPSSLHLI